MTTRAVLLLLALLAGCRADIKDDIMAVSADITADSADITADSADITADSADRPWKLLWSDEFDSLDDTKWVHKVSTYPQETFHYTRNNRANSWVEDGALNLMFSLTSDTYGEEFLEEGELDLYEEDSDHPCNEKWGQAENCYSKAGADLVKPLQAAKLTTEGLFSFRYGRVEVRAKLPVIPWAFAALWLMPTHSVYGGWPTSGEIDIVEASGMRDYHCGATPWQVDALQTNLHFGPSRQQKWSDPTIVVNKTSNFADSWHIWEMDWTPDHMIFSFDGVETYRLTAPGQPGGLWDMAGFQGDNIYKAGGAMAPWDQEFYLLLSFGTGAWPFYSWCSPPAPWDEGSKDPRRQLWAHKEEWLAGWEQPWMIDYIRVYK